MSDIIRRDPRAEWIARNRLHPLHAALQPTQQSWMGPNGVLRKNVHGVGFIGPNGIKRIDRSGVQQGGASKRTARVEVQLPLHQVPAPAFYIAVVPDMVGGRLSSHDRDLLGLAHQLAGAKRRPSSPPPERLSGSNQCWGANWLSTARKLNTCCSGA